MWRDFIDFFVTRNAEDYATSWLARQQSWRGVLLLCKVVQQRAYYYRSSYSLLVMHNDPVHRTVLSRSLGKQLHGEKHE